MATATQPPVSLYEYLHTSYRPDRDYVDGELEERNLGELDHSAVQRALLVWLSQNWDKKSTRSFPELRIQVSPTRYRIADICLISRSAPREQIVQTPPLAVIEILSPEDRIGRYHERLDDYRKMGIVNIWVVDPTKRKGFDCSTGSWIETSRFAPAGVGPSLELGALFAEVDAQS